MVGPYGLNLVRVGISLVLFWMLWLAGKAMRNNKTVDAALSLWTDGCRHQSNPLYKGFDDDLHYSCIVTDALHTFADHASCILGIKRKSYAN